MKARWIGEGDGTKLVGRNEAETNKGKGQQRQGQRNETRIISQKGVDEHKKQSRNGRHKRKTRENDKLRVVLKKRILGGGGETKQNISRIAGNPLSVSAIRAPLLKNTRIAGKTAFFLS